MIKIAVKSGKLANGFQSDRGSVVHAIETESDLYLQDSLCGDRPEIQWSELDPEVRRVTCKKCLKKLHLFDEVFKALNSEFGYTLEDESRFKEWFYSNVSVIKDVNEFLNVPDAIRHIREKCIG